MREEILDATAGNRLMWKTKDHPEILYIDIEKELEFPPDKVLDCTNTDFPDNSFYSVFFDPPHAYGIPKNERIFTIPSRKRAIEKFNYRRTYPSYYGLDKFNNKQELLDFIYESQKEFYRILKKNGMLWFKWSEYTIDVKTVLKIFQNWSIMLFLPLKQTPRGKNPSFWIMFMKKDSGLYQFGLTELKESNKIE